MSIDWKETGAGNQIHEGDGFFVSYNPDCSAGVCGLFDHFLGIDQEEETAIVWHDKYLILNGDHRDSLANRSIEECLGYFLNHEGLHSPTSDQFVL